MCCALCGTYPKWLGFDGVSLALNKDKVLWDTVDTIFPKNGSTEPPILTVKKQKERMLLPVAHTRVLLATFCTAKPNPMNCDEFGELCAALLSECPPLYTMLRELFAEEKRATSPIAVYNFSFAGNWKPFLVLLSSTTSVAWLFRPTIVPLLLHLIDTKVYTADHHQILSEFCPPLAHSLSHLSEGNLPDYLVQLLAVMVDIVKSTHPEMTFVPTVPSPVIHIPTSITTTRNSDLPDSGPHLDAWFIHLRKVVEHVEQNHTALSIPVDLTQLKEKYSLIPELDSTLSGTYYPNWPKYRQMPRIKGIDPAPSAKDVREWSDEQDSPLEAELFCVKEEQRGYKHRKLIAGEYVSVCLHGIVYGLHLMLEPEGRKDMAKVLYERFPKEVLDAGPCFLYDFNCQTAEYLYNRFPEQFVHVCLFIDRWHAASHKCASIFKLQTYPVYQQMVSTASEMANSFLQYMHGQTPFMRQETHMTLMKATTGIRNLIINDELNRLMRIYVNKS